MNPAAILLVSGLMAAQRGALPTVDRAPPDPERGQALARQCRLAAPTERTQFSGALNVTRDRHTTVIPVTGQVIPGEPTWQVIYEVPGTNDRPAEKLVIVHATNGPNRYLHARANQAGQPAGDPVEVPPDRIAAPLAGSDFWLLDLGLDFFHWPTQRFLHSTMLDTRVCLVLESVQPHPPPGGYARVLSWVDKETGGPLKAEAYDAHGKRVKEFSIKSLKKVEGRWELQEMEMRDLRTRSRTRLEFTFPQGQAR